MRLVDGTLEIKLRSKPARRKTPNKFADPRTPTSHLAFARYDKNTGAGRIHVLPLGEARRRFGSVATKGESYSSAAVIEGMYARETSLGRIVMFRPRAHAERMVNSLGFSGADYVDPEFLIAMWAAGVDADREEISRHLTYMRPWAFDNEESVTPGPADQITLGLRMWLSGGNYGSTSAPIALLPSSESRIAVGNLFDDPGSRKLAANYAAGENKDRAAFKRWGVKGTLYTHGGLIQEFNTSCLAIQYSDGRIRFPDPYQVKGILPSITVDSMIQIGIQMGLDIGYEVITRDAFIRRLGKEIVGLAKVGTATTLQQFYEVVSIWSDGRRGTIKTLAELAERDNNLERLRQEHVGVLEERIEPPSDDWMHIVPGVIELNGIRRTEKTNVSLEEYVRAA